MRRSLFVVCALGVIACATACSAIVGIGDLTPSGSSSGGTSSGTSSGASSSSGTSGSSTSSSSGGGSTAAFLGTWTITSGNSYLTCDGQTESEPDTGQLVVTAGTSSQLEFGGGSGGCSFAANVTNADTATLVQGQTCTQTGNSSTAVLEPTDGTFVVHADGTATVTITGNATVTSNGGETNCTFEELDQYSM